MSYRRFFEVFVNLLFLVTLSTITSTSKILPVVRSASFYRLVNVCMYRIDIFLYYI